MAIIVKKINNALDESNITQFSKCDNLKLNYIFILFSLVAVLGNSGICRGQVVNFMTTNVWRTLRLQSPCLSVVVPSHRTSLKLN